MGDMLMLKVWIFKEEAFFSSSSEHHLLNFGSTSNGWHGYQLIPLLVELRESWLFALLCCAVFCKSGKKSCVRDDHLFKTIFLIPTVMATLKWDHIFSDTELCLANLFKISHQIPGVPPGKANKRLHISSSSPWSTQGWDRHKPLLLHSPQICPHHIHLLSLAASIPLNFQSFLVLISIFF